MFRWSIETHTFVAALGEFTPTLEDVAQLIVLPSYVWEKKCYRDSPQGRGSGEVEVSAVALTASSSSRESTYATWLSFSYERDGS